jgi:hypothetical protein
MVKRIPKAKDVNLGLQNVPKWLSGVKIPSILAKTFGINPGQMGGLTLESLAEAKALSEGALLQVEMAHKFFDYLKNVCESHEEIERLRSEAVQLMYSTKTREDASIMSALLSETKYQEHYETWQHELEARKHLIKEKGNLDRDYLTENFKNKLLIAIEYGKRKKEKSDNSVKALKDNNSKNVKDDLEKEKQLKEARAKLDRILKG